MRVIKYDETVAESPMQAVPGVDGRLFVLRVDGMDMIRFVNPSWLEFARENGCPHLNGPLVLDQPLCDFISGDSAPSLTQNLMRKVRTTSHALTVPFRCDSPGCRRFMEMEILPQQLNGLEFRSRLVREEFRKPVSLLDLAIEHSSEFVSVCSWCKKLRVRETQWLEIEDGIRLLNLFDETHPPQITHGICPPCLDHFETTILE